MSREPFLMRPQLKLPLSACTQSYEECLGSRTMVRDKDTIGIFSRNSFTHSFIHAFVRSFSPLDSHTCHRSNTAVSRSSTLIITPGCRPLIMRTPPFKASHSSKSKSNRIKKKKQTNKKQNSFPQKTDSQSASTSTSSAWREKKPKLRHICA